MSKRLRLKLVAEKLYIIIIDLRPIYLWIGAYKLSKCDTFDVYFRATISIAISTHIAPKMICRVRRLTPMNTPNNPVKTGSMVMTMAAIVADTRDCPSLY
jgi:hypothetical protein